MVSAVTTIYFAEKDQDLKKKIIEVGNDTGIKMNTFIMRALRAFLTEEPDLFKVKLLLKNKPSLITQYKNILNEVEINA